MDNGWIKLHRKIWDNPISKKPNYAWVWCYLVSMANHADKKFIWNNKKQLCKRGQIVTGRKEIAKETGVPDGSIERILKYLENEHQIEQQKTTKFRLITVKNYNLYQNNEHQIEQQMNNKRATDEHKQELKNDKNINISFETFWNLYDKKVGRPKCKKKWAKLKDEERQAIIDYIPRYKHAQSVKKYRKNPETFFNNRSWEDEIIQDDRRKQNAVRKLYDGTHAILKNGVWVDANDPYVKMNLQYYPELTK